MRITKSITEAVTGSLKLKLVLFIVTLLALSIGIAPWSAIKLQERQLLRASEDRLRSLHETLRKAIVATCMLSGDPASVQGLLEAVSTHEDIEVLRIFDTGGLIRHSSHLEELGEHLSPAELSRYRGRGDPVLLGNGEKTALHTLVRPMFNGPECISCHRGTGKIIGILQVSFSLQRPWRQLASLRRYAVLANVITLGVIITGIWMSLTVLVDQPLSHLVQVMGRAKHGDLSARAESRSNDELGQLAGHFNDMISKLYTAQEELRRFHQEQLARADRLATIGELAAAIAHEIRNPLTGISGALSVLSRGFHSDDPRREVVAQTHLLIDRLNKSVNSILHYSRPSPPQLQLVKLDDIVDRTLSLVEGEARKARIDVIRETARENGGDGDYPAVNADPHQIQQVLTNLVLNAIQATAAGGRIWIRTHVSENQAGGKRACVEIEDNGRGMTPDDSAKAFQPFFSTKAEGTGLGLAIAQQIIEQHQGRVSLRSTLGKGTWVQVELPAHPPVSSQET